MTRVWKCFAHLVAVEGSCVCHGWGCGGICGSLAWRSSKTGGRRRAGVFWTMSIILFVLWVLGMISGSTEGLWVHFLLAMAVVTLILAVSQRGRRVLA